MAQSGVIDDPQFAGASLCREKSVVFVHTLNCIKRAGVRPESVSAH